ncbi:MAG: hypothetical protein B7733_20165 [Myxococcales bacterium FL481]|nr:MAG: hypothetical protein B7733_20165 [Myxococcales bacterium FL481]
MVKPMGIVLQTSVFPVVDALAPLASSDHGVATLDMGELQRDLETLASEALSAQMAGLSLAAAVHDERFPALREFHRDLRDTLFVEVPRDMAGWVQQLQQPDSQATRGVSGFYDRLFEHAYSPDAASPLFRPGGDDPAALSSALARLLLFEAVRLRLLVAAWSSHEYESLGGEETDIDAIACAETEALLSEPSLDDPHVRPLPVMMASASIALARDAADRADLLRGVGEDERERLRMRARLRAALRELRLPEAVLLENALASLTGDHRVELTELQADRPVALEGLSRQAMDQRISRGRRALAKARRYWPSRRKPALYDMIRERSSADPATADPK